MNLKGNDESSYLMLSGIQHFQFCQRQCCESYGLRMQNSVFECILDATQFKQL